MRTSGGQTLLLNSQARGTAIILSSVGQTSATFTAVTTAAAASPNVSSSLHPTLQAKVVPQQVHGEFICEMKKKLS